MNQPLINGGNFFGKEEAPQGAFSAPAWNTGKDLLRPEGRPLVMGILNLTPDSFHAPSRQGGIEATLRTVQAMAQAGADVLDLG